jgi:hypothetical protein
VIQSPITIGIDQSNNSVTFSNVTGGGANLGVVQTNTGGITNTTAFAIIGTISL